ncbi:putative lipoprotein YiaD [bacterium HR40]|nr:putative lipoprotein YiaD [bacterium HR40]
MARNRSLRERVDIWPGFVDALSTLLLVFIFLLVVFVLAQFFLGRMLQSRDVVVERLRAEVATLARALESERSGAEELRRSLARAAADLQSAMAERERVAARLAESESARDELDRKLLQLSGERQMLEQALTETREQREQMVRRSQQLEADLERLRRTLEDRIREREQKLAELAALVQQLQSERDAAVAESGRSAERIRSLSEQIATLSDQLRVVSEALDARQAEIDRQAAVIADLGTRLNLALASKVEELSRYRSDFFGKLRQLLGDRPDVRVVGDRFVFQAEVLFATGEAEINPEGRRQLAQFATAFREIMTGIPEELPWVLQVDGHTDRRPINTPRFPSNWELSTARAIAVANFLISQGIPPQRVAARGFAEFQPLDPGDTEEAYRRNRRIEIKLTTR